MSRRKRMRLLPAVVLLFVSCQTPPPPCAVEGGFAKRYRVTGLILPTQKSDFAVDLTGNGHEDNGLGNILGFMHYENVDTQSPVDRAFQSADQTMVLDLQSRDPAQANAEGVGIAIGEPTGGAPGELCGYLTHGAFDTLPSKLAPAQMTLTLAFVENQRAPLTTVRASFTTNADGTLAGELNGVLPAAQIGPVFWHGVGVLLIEKVTNFPLQPSSKDVLDTFDTGGNDDPVNPSGCKNPDGTPACRNPFGPDAGTCAQRGDRVISTCEVGTNSIVRNLFAPDVSLAGSLQHNALSFGVGFTAVPQP